MARKYTRDNRGRFASGGGGATARGGRLATAGGKKRATQTMKTGKRSAPDGAIRATDVGKAKTRNYMSKMVEKNQARYDKAAIDRNIFPRAENKTTRLIAAQNAVAGQKRSSIGSVGARLAARDRATGRGDGAAVNIPMSGARGKRLDAEITRNVKAQAAQLRKADKARNVQFKSEQSRAKKLRAVHVPGIAKAKGVRPSQVESALKAQPPGVQVKALKNWVKQNRATAKRK